MISLKSQNFIALSFFGIRQSKVSFKQLSRMPPSKDSPKTLQRSSSLEKSQLSWKKAINKNPSRPESLFFSNPKTTLLTFSNEKRRVQHSFVHKRDRTPIHTIQKRSRSNYRTIQRGKKGKYSLLNLLLPINTTLASSSNKILVPPATSHPMKIQGKEETTKEDINMIQDLQGKKDLRF